MSEQFDERNRGVLFKNTRKVEKHHADYEGKFTDGNGQEFWLDAWVMESRKDGKKFMSLRARPKQQQKPTKQDYRNDPRQQSQRYEKHERQPDAPPAGHPASDDIPF